MIKFLILSDIHLGWENLEKFKALFHEKYSTINLDVLFLLGDFDTISHDPSKSQEERDKQNADSQENIQQIFKFLSFFPGRKLYIPGNHDSAYLYQATNDVIPDFENIHMKTVDSSLNQIQLIKNLYVVGIGGSVPGIFSLTGEKAFNGFPFENDLQMKESLSKLEIPQDSQIIFATHVGPINTKTNIALIEGESIEFGSESLRQFIESNKNIMINIHGHCHDGFGEDKIGETRIFNQGSLLHGGRFGYFEAKEENSKWKIEMCSIINL